MRCERHETSALQPALHNARSHDGPCKARGSDFRGHRDVSRSLCFPRYSRGPSSHTHFQPDHDDSTTTTHSEAAKAGASSTGRLACRSNHDARHHHAGHSGPLPGLSVRCPAAAASCAPAAPPAPAHQGLPPACLMACVSGGAGRPCGAMAPGRVQTCHAVPSHRRRCHHHRQTEPRVKARPLLPDARSAIPCDVMTWLPAMALRAWRRGAHQAGEKVKAGGGPRERRRRSRPKACSDGLLRGVLSCSSGCSGHSGHCGS